MGFRGVEAQADEDRGKDKARGAYPQPIWGSEVWKLILNQYGVRGAWSQPEEGGGEDKAGKLILNQYGVRGAWSQPEEGGGKDKAGGLILNQYGVRGTRSPHCHSTNMGFRSAWSQSEEGGGGLILNQYGFPRCVVST